MLIDEIENQDMVFSLFLDAPSSFFCGHCTVCPSSPIQTIYMYYFRIGKNSLNIYL